MNAPAFRTALLIANPGSRSADSPELANAAARLEEAGLRVRRVDSTSPEHARQAIALHAGRVELVILAGGDGTIHSAAPALVEHDLPFAVLPMGTANDLARSLSIPLKLEEAVDAIIAGNRTRIDLGRANGHYFFNAVNVGLGVTINHELTAEDKQRWGVFSYLKALFAGLKRQETFRATIEVDGKVHHLRSKQVAVGNGRFYGGGNVIDEEASINEGLLHVYSIAPKSFWELIRMAPFLRAGKSGESCHYFRASGRQIRLETRTPMEVFTDGEQTSHTPLTLECIPGALLAVTGGRPEAGAQAEAA